MATKVYEADAGDLDGSNVTFSTDLSEKDERRTLLYVNDLDVSVTVDAKLTHHTDTSLSDAYVGNTQTVTSGSRGADTLHQDVWERVGGELSFSANPSSGTITVYLISRGGV